MRLCSSMRSCASPCGHEGKLFAAILTAPEQEHLDALEALPALFLGILVLTIVTPSYGSLMFAIGLVMLPVAQRQGAQGIEALRRTANAMRWIQQP